MKYTLFATIVSLFFVIASCDKNGVIDPKPLEEVIDTTLPEFVFPLAVGNKWTYFSQGTFLDTDRFTGLRQTFNHKTTVYWEISEQYNQSKVQLFRRKVSYSRWSWRIDAPEYTGYAESDQGEDTIFKTRKYTIIGKDSILRYSSQYLGTVGDTITFQSGYAGRYSSVNYHKYANRVGKVYWSAYANLAGGGAYNLISYQLK